MASPIYVIAVSTALGMDKGFPTFKPDIVGWYPDKETAFSSVRNNTCNIWETCYKYAVIEESNAGLYDSSHTRWFFKFNEKTKEYEEIDEPEGYEHFSGLVIS